MECAGKGGGCYIRAVAEHESDSNRIQQHPKTEKKLKKHKEKEQKHRVEKYEIFQESGKGKNRFLIQPFSTSSHFNNNACLYFLPKIYTVVQ